MSTMESLVPTATENAATKKTKKSFKPKPSSKRNNNAKDKKNSKGAKRDKNDKKVIKVLKKGVTSIEFDATARYEHLTGFSERKRARRAYGLAQQKIKDRKSKLEHRAAIRTAERDFIEEAEQLKQQHYQLQLQQQRHGALIINAKNHDNDDDNDYQSTVMNKAKQQATEETVQILFDGEETEQQWGGHVVVTTSTHIPGDSDDDDDDEDDNDDERNKKRCHTTENHDTEQQYAGNIERYIKTIKGNLPSKKKRTAPSVGNNATSSNKRTKGQHGATNMKGVGSAADMKVAQKMLSRSTSKFTKGSSSAGGGKKGRKGGKR